MKDQRNSKRLEKGVNDTVKFITDTFKDNVKRVRHVNTKKHGTVLHSAYIDFVTTTGIKKVRVSDHRSHLLKQNEFALEVSVNYKPSKGIYQHTDTMGIVNAICRM